MALSSGDFDGDSLLDLALLEQSDPSASGADGLSVAYGAAEGGLRQASRVASLTGARSLSTWGFSARKGLDDLGVVLDGSTQGSSSVSVFPGDANRGLVASLTLSAPEPEDASTQIQAIPLLVTAGRFTGGDADDLAAIGFEVSLGAGGSARVWLASRQSGALRVASASAALSSIDILPAPGGGRQQEGLPAALAAGDLDGDGKEELLLAGKSQGGGATLSVLRAEQQSDGFRFVVRSTIELPSLSSGPRARAAVAVSDLDGDGGQDVAVLIDDGQRPQTAVVVWGDGKGGLSAAQTPLSPPGGAARAMAVVRAGSHGERRLALVTDTTLSLLIPAATQGGTPSFSPLAQASGARSLSARDMDGDGLEDLVLIDDAGLRLLVARAVRP